MKSTLKFKFIAIVIIAALPFLLYALINYYSDVLESKKTAIQQNASRTLELAHVIYDFIESSQQVLYALSLHPAVINKDRKECDAIFSRLLPLYPHHLNILAADMNGRNIGSGVEPEKAHTLDYTDKEWFKRGSNGVAAVSDLHLSKLFSQPAFMITMPVFNSSGDQTAVLGFPANLFSLQEHLITTVAVTADDAFTVIDNNGIVLMDTQYREHIGKPFKNAPLISAIGKGSSGSLLHRDPADITRFYSYATVETTGWKVLLGLPASAVYNKAKLTAVTHFVIFALICGTGILCSLLYSRRIGNKVAALINGFNEIAAGNLDYSVTIPGKDEFASAAHAFNRMISDRKIAEDEIRNLAASLEKRVAERTAELLHANNELEAFSYTVSHDLQAPARHVIAFSEILLKDHGAELSEESCHLLERIRKAGENMRDMIAHLLTLSTLSRKELHRIHCDLSSLCSTINSELKKAEPERNVSVTIEEGLFVDADPVLLEIMIKNLLENAWKYTGKSADPRIDIGKTVHNGMHCFFIKDNGCGFDMAYSQKLFVPFQRLHSEKEYDGSGVGLATVFRIVQRHGGVITAQSAPGAGAVFYFTMSKTEPTVTQEDA